MKDHPYAVFFDVLWDVTSPRGIDDDGRTDRGRRRRGLARRLWLRLRHRGTAPTVEDAPDSTRGRASDAPIERSRADVVIR